MTVRRNCLVLIRRNPKNDSFKYSDDLFYRVVQPVFKDKGFFCHQVDPRDFGPDDAKLFRMIESADVMIVDASAESSDYSYCLGVRHALTNKPTLIFVAVEYVPFDIRIPKGLYYISEGRIKHDHFSWMLEARNWLEEQLKEIMANQSEETYSPVRSALEEIPRVFLSYTHVDAESVRAIDQWLRNKGARVDIDERNFIAGKDIRDEIVKWIRNAGKVVCFYSRASYDRYYTKLERRIAEEIEMNLRESGQDNPVLLYFRLDETPLPTESSYRLAINAWQLEFEDACNELWRHIVQKIAEPKHIPLDKYRKKAPWHR